MKIISVAGVRPNFMKVAPLHLAFRQHPDLDSKLVYTGQHYSPQMSEVFRQQLDLPQPDHYVGVRAGSQTAQTAEIMLRFEEIITAERPNWVVVVGDVTSTLACALAAVRAGVRVAHVEAGLRSFDRRMPEEINRTLTDQLADLLFVTEQSGLDNLRCEGIPVERVHFVGNVMIDSLMHYRPRAAELNTVGALGLLAGNYVLMTMHRPANVDTEAGLRTILQIVSETARLKTVVFPLHPRTETSLRQFGVMDEFRAVPNVRLLEPQGYLEFLNLMENAAIVITDSGGVQEETTYLQVPCLTLRDSTERPITVDRGTNQLIPRLDADLVRQKVVEILDGQSRKGQIPPLWDGQAAGRIADVIRRSTFFA